MKTISLFALLLFISAAAPAQRNKVGVDILTGINKDSAAKWISLFNGQAVSHPQSEIIQLSLDNMPCLVPDIATVAEMPTLKTDLSYQFIPNPYFNYHSPAVNSNVPAPVTSHTLPK